MKGFLNNDIKRLIVSLSIRNKNKEIVKAIKTHVKEYKDEDKRNIRKQLLQFYKGKWTYELNNYFCTFGIRLKYSYLYPTCNYFDDGNLTEISTINGQIYLFEKNVLKPIEHYGYNMKTWNDMYNYFKKKFNKNII